MRQNNRLTKLEKRRKPTPAGQGLRMPEIDYRAGLTRPETTQETEAQASRGDVIGLRLFELAEVKHEPTQPIE